MKNHTIPWGAISAKLKGVAGEEETKQIQEWLDFSAENQLVLNEIVHVWSITKGKSEFYQPDMSYNWKKLMDRINQRSTRKFPLTPYLRPMVAAAVLILVFLAGITFSEQLDILPKSVAYSKIISPKGNKTQVILPDSSRVWLNSGAELWYSSDYSSDNRQVWMKGECYFQIEKDPRHPFIVHGSKILVKVFGTCFNMKEDEIRDISDVLLVSGNVKVLDLESNKISDLLPGQQLKFSQGKGEVKQAENLEASTSWINNILIFQNQPFEEVISYLSGWYGVNIRYDHTLYYRHKYTFKVKTESLREVLELITIITPIDYRIEGDQITIKYKPKM